MIILGRVFYIFMKPAGEVEAMELRVVTGLMREALRIVLGSLLSLSMKDVMSFAAVSQLEDRN